MFEPLDPTDYLDPSDRQIWRQQPENGGRLLHGFAGQLKACEDRSDSVYLKWYGQAEASGLPQRIRNKDFWPSAETTFRKNYPAELELALFEVWPAFESESVQLTIDLLNINQLRLNSRRVADQITAFYVEHQSKIDLIMFRFNCAKVFEQAQIDWLDEQEMGDSVLSAKLDSLFFDWRLDDAKLKPTFEFLGEKNIEVGCRFIDYFFSGILRNSFAKASLQIKKEEDDQAGDDTGSFGLPHDPRDGGLQP